MAWTKIPKEHHPVFRAAMPDDPRATTMEMFGGLCALINGHMFAGLWDDTVMVRLGEAARAEVLAMEGSTPFDPMGKGRPMKEMVLLPREVFVKPRTLKSWMKKALDHTATLPPKKKPSTKAAPRKAAPKKAAK